MRNDLVFFKIKLPSIIKYFFIILFLLTSVTKLISQNINCDLMLNPEDLMIDGEGTIFPGDTICLLAGPKNYLFLKNIHGTEEEPVVIINKDGQVVIDTDHYFGIKFDGCSFVKLSGNGLDAYQYGILVSRVENGAGISVDNKSTNIEIEYIEISNTSIGGIYAKTEPDPYGDCTFPAVRSKFTMYNTIIHDNYLHDIADEGMYIGSSKYTGQYIYNCDTTVLPHVLIGVKVYNNILENTGWDGIQVSSAVSDCEIYGNYIIGDSYAEEEYQMSGILIGGGSNCDCYNNRIEDGKGDGIDVFGLGNQKIYNNLIINPGKTYFPGGDPTIHPKHGIYVGHVSTIENAGYYFYNNTIIKPKTTGIRFANTYSYGNKIINNIITEPGAFSEYGDDSFINISDPSINITISNNLKSNDLNTIKFDDPIVGNYDLQLGSPAINSGMNLATEEINFDILNRFRPFAAFFDIGAYECHKPGASIGEISLQNNYIQLKENRPNPFSDNTIIEFFIPKKARVELLVFNSIGVLVKEVTNEIIEAGNHKVKFDSENLSQGIYYFKLKAFGKSLTKKMIIL
jgi:hypothetical protein